MDTAHLNKLTDRLEKTERELIQLKEKNDRMDSLLQNIGKKLDEIMNTLTKNSDQVDYNTITAEKIVIRGAEGFLILDCSGIIFFDETRQPHISLIRGGDSDGLGFIDKNGMVRSIFGFSGDNPSLILKDKRGTVRLMLGELQDENLGMFFNDKFGKNRIYFGLSGEGSPSLGLFDDRQKLRMIIKINDDDNDNIYIVMLDAYGNIISKFPE
jgi:hypothetical protein